MSAPSTMAGNDAPPRPRAPGPGWSARTAYVGDDVLLGAVLTGFPAGTPVTFKIFPSTGEPARAMSTIKTASDETGVATGEWRVKFDPARHEDPRLLFETTAAGTISVSGPLLVVDKAEIALEVEGKGPLANAEVTLLDGIGGAHDARSDEQGIVRVDPIPIGRYAVVVKGHLVRGERAPGEKRFFTGAPARATLEKLPFSIELESPRAGDVFVVGDRVPVKVVVKKDGQVVADVQPALRAAGTKSAKIHHPPAKPGAALEGPFFLAGDDDGDVEIVAEHGGVRGSAKVRVVRPRVAKLELVDAGGTVFPLFDRATGAERGPAWELAPDGRVARAHAAAVKMGSLLRVRVYLATSDRPSKPARFSLGIATDPIAHDGGKTAPLLFLLPNGGASVSWSGDPSAPLELEANAPLPACVRSYRFTLDVRASTRFIRDEASFAAAAPLGKVEGVDVIAIWGRPQVADGGVQEAGAEPLPRGEFDPFHVARAARWADGGRNLLLDDPASIPLLLQRNMAHYVWPDDYDGKDGRPKADHPRPKNADALPGSGIADAPVLRLGVAAYRCARHRGNVFPHPDAVGGRCERCAGARADSPGRPGFFLAWREGAYTCTAPGCGARLGSGPIGAAPLAECPVCATGRSLLEAQCAACKEWTDERAFATGAHRCPEGAEARAEPATPRAQSWGLGVLDDPDQPGGEPHQVAAAMAAALGALGVRAGVRYARRRGGAVNRKEHDPVTRGAIGFDRIRDWGASLAAFVFVPVDASHDADFPGAKVREDEPIVFEPPVRGGERRRATAKEAQRTGRARKVPVREKLAAEVCRAGHPLKVPARADAFDIPFGGAAGLFSFEGGGDAKIEVAEARLASAPGGEADDDGAAFAGALEVWIDGAYRGRARAGAPLAVKLAPGRHAGRIAARGLRPGRRVEGKLRVTTAALPPEATFAAVAARVANDRPHTKGDPRAAAIRAFIETDGELRAAFTLAPHHSFAVALGFQAGDGPLVEVPPCPPGESTAAVDLGPVKPGVHEVKVFPVGIAWPWSYFEGTLALEGKKKRALPRSCPTCGAQPRWTYACGKCGKPLAGDRPSGRHECGEALDALIEAIVYPCPNCGRTVHDEDKDCWSCGAPLTSGGRSEWK